MPRGGPRNRGPVVRSATSDAGRARRAGALLLPHDGHQGNAPPYPLPDPCAREIAVWCEAWGSPQACAWALEPWRWRTIALWARWSVRSEHPEAPAALVGQVTRLADQIGLTPAGLAENGWRIAEPDEPATVPDGRPARRRSRRASADAEAPAPIPLDQARRARTRDPRRGLHDS